MTEYKIYAAGNFVQTNDTLSVCNPYNHEEIGFTYLANDQLLNETIDKAISVKKELSALPASKRYRILMDIAEKLSENEKQISRVLAMEAAKPLKYAVSEVHRAIQVFIVAAEEAKRLPKEYIGLDWTLAGEKREGLIKHFPLGLIAGISPFNFPLNLAVHKIAPAIAAACPIILKPSSTTPLSALLLAKIIDETQLPKGALSVLPMNRANGNLLVTDERFKLLTFTGSAEVGWQMKASAGKKKVVLELGGNAAAIVSSSTDIHAAVKKLIVGAFAYSGQVCIHAQRIFVHQSCFQQFVELFIEAANKLKYGDPLDSDTDISVMIDERNAIRVESWINEALTEGAKLLFGSKRVNNYVEPTILTNTSPKMKVNKMEVFGPVVTLEPYSDFAQAIDLVNDSDFGLQAAVFTDSIQEMNLAFDSIETGGIIINDSPSFRVDHMPYGGIKDSGLGREGVRYAIYDMLEPRILVKPF